MPTSNNNITCTAYSDIKYGVGAMISANQSPHKPHLLTYFTATPGSGSRDYPPDS